MITLNQPYTYDSEADAIFMKVSDARPVDAFEAHHGIILHLDADDQLQGIEIYPVSKVAPALIPEGEAADTAAE